MLFILAVLNNYLDLTVLIKQRFKMKSTKYLAYYENYLKMVAHDLNLPVVDCNGDDIINIADYENILKVYFRGKIPENWKCKNCTKCKYCIGCNNCKWCTGCNGCVACTKCTGTINGFGHMFQVTGAKADKVTTDIIVRPKNQSILEKILNPFMKMLY